ncbi:hypothetical protein J6590_004275, partial [Homalodisca vitripennis]
NYANPSRPVRPISLSSMSPERVVTVVQVIFIDVKDLDLGQRRHCTVPNVNTPTSEDESPSRSYMWSHTRRAIKIQLIKQ